MKRLTALFLALCLSLVLTGCVGSGSSGRYQLYFRADPETSPHGSALASQRYQGKGTPTVDDLCQALFSGPTEKGLVSPFPQGVTLQNWSLEDGLLTLDLSEQYGGLADVSLTLADYCLVLTLSQLEGVEAVQIQSAGHTYHSRSHQSLTAGEALLDPDLTPSAS